MNTMTFTIESVHGVKQTFVVAPTAKTDSRDESSKEMSAQDRQANENGEWKTPPTR